MDQTENKENMEAMEEEQIVVITDDEGNELYFREEMVVPVGKKKFAILAQINLEDCECEDEDCHCHEHEEDEEENVIIARIEFDENGEEVYLAPTDEEFDEVKAAYEKLMEGKKANLVVTDPPYNVNYEGSAGKIQNDNLEDDKFYNFLFAAFVNMEQNMERDASIYVFHADTEGLNFRRAFKAAGFYLSGTCIWKKQSLVLGRSPYQWQHEPILFGWKLGGKHMWYSDRKQSTIWEYDRPKKNDMHPTMKPVELVAYPIRNSSMSNCIVLDPFGGSGSTLIACEQTGRTCRTIELDEKYADVIVHRYMEFVGSAEDVYVVRDGKRIKYSELMKEGDTHDAVDLP